MMPTAQMSVRSSIWSAPHCSGDMYRNVPIGAPCSVTTLSCGTRVGALVDIASMSSSRASLSAVAMPKSSTLASTAQKHVLGLGVSVDDAVLVSANERPHHGNHQRQRVGDRHCRCGVFGFSAPGRRGSCRGLAGAHQTGKATRQRLSFEVFEDYVGTPIHLVRVVDDHDVLVLAASRGPGLGQEPPGHFPCRYMEKPDRYQTTEAPVVGEKHGAHTTLPRRAQELVTIDLHTGHER
jgi:hypothetical protein